MCLPYYGQFTECPHSVSADRVRKPESWPSAESRGPRGATGVPQLLPQNWGAARGLPANHQSQGPVYREIGEGAETTDSGVQQNGVWLLLSTKCYVVVSWVKVLLNKWFLLN